MDIRGKTCLLTGATGGIGAAAARALAGAGSHLILVSRSADKLESLAAGLPGEGHRTVAADLASREGREGVLSACPGGIDVLINNAGLNPFGLLADQQEEQLRQMIEVNALAPMLLTQALLPRFTVEQLLPTNSH